MVGGHSNWISESCQRVLGNGNATGRLNPALPLRPSVRNVQQPQKGSLAGIKTGFLSLAEGVWAMETRPGG